MADQYTSEQRSNIRLANQYLRESEGGNIGSVYYGATERNDRGSQRTIAGLVLVAQQGDQRAINALQNIGFLPQKSTAREAMLIGNVEQQFNQLAREKRTPFRYEYRGATNLKGVPVREKVYYPEETRLAIKALEAEGYGGMTTNEGKVVYSKGVTPIPGNQSKAPTRNIIPSKIITQSPTQPVQQNGFTNQQAESALAGLDPSGNITYASKPVSEVQPYKYSEFLPNGPKENVSYRIQQIQTKQARGLRLTPQEEATLVAGGVAMSFIDTAYFGASVVTNPADTVKQVGRGLFDVGKRVITGEGFDPSIAQKAKANPTYTLGYVGGELLQGKFFGDAGSLAWTKVKTPIIRTIGKFDPKGYVSKTFKIGSVDDKNVVVTRYEDIKGTQSTFDIEQVPPGRNILSEGQRQTLEVNYAEPVSKQATRGAFGYTFGEQIDMVMRQGPFVSAQTTLNTLTEPLSRPFWVSPPDPVTGRGQLRISRLSGETASKEASILDVLTGNVDNPFKKNYAFVFEEATGTKPKGPKGFETPYLELKPTGEIQGIGRFPSSEAESVIAQGEQLVKQGFIGRLYTSTGERIRVLSVKIKDKFTSNKPFVNIYEPSGNVYTVENPYYGPQFTTSVKLSEAEVKAFKGIYEQKPQLPASYYTTPAYSVTTSLFSTTRRTNTTSGGSLTSGSSSNPILRYPVGPPSSSYETITTKRLIGGSSGGGGSSKRNQIFYTPTYIPGGGSGGGSGGTPPYNPPYSPPPRIPTFVPGPPPTKIFNNEFGPPRFLSSRKYGGRKGTAYTPSFTAIIFNIRGRRGRQSTGVNLRPITKGFKWPSLKNLKTQIRL